MKMIMGVSPVGDIKWHYFKCSKQQYDVLHNAVNQRKAEKVYPELVKNMEDVTQEMIELGHPPEAYIDDPVFPNLKKLTIQMKGEKESVDDSFKRIAANAYMSVRFEDKDGVLIRY